MSSVTGVVAGKVNARAKRKYMNLLTSVEVLVGTLPAVEKRIRKMSPSKKGRTYRMATPEELLAKVALIRKGLVDFTEVCKQHETQLTTTEWTV